eukprot:g1671.t1
MVYFNCEFPKDGKPKFPLPFFVERELQSPRWKSLSAWDIGRVQLLPTDWVDQAGDFAHFHTLHNEFVVPWTTIGLPEWISRIVSISHSLKTYVGEKATKLFGTRSGGDHDSRVNKHYIYFTDEAGIRLNGRLLETTTSKTLEMYCGPAFMIFHIPFGDHAFKVFVSTTPCPGGSIMRARTFCTASLCGNPLMRFIAWLLVGVSAAQLKQDIVIMENRTRLRKPQLVPFDGPYMRTGAWLKQFYSENSGGVGHEASRPFHDVLGW